MATTVRNCAFVLNSASANTQITLYEPGKTPGQVDSGRVCGRLINLFMVASLPGLPLNTAKDSQGNYLNTWSGKSIEFLLRHNSTGNDTRLKRIDLAASSQEYTIYLKNIIFGEFFFSPDSRLSTRIMSGTGLINLANTEEVRIYGSFSESNETA